MPALKLASYRLPDAPELQIDVTLRAAELDGGQWERWWT